MLVISRKTEEFIQIGEQIVVKIIKTANGSVKIGVDAPPGTRVLRGELMDVGDQSGESLESARLPSRMFRVLAESREAASAV